MFSATSQKYAHEFPALGPQNMYVGSNGLIRNYTTARPSTKKSYMTIQTVVLTFSVLFCIFCSFLTVTLSYKWYTDTNMMFGRIEGAIGGLAHDVRAVSDLVKYDIKHRRPNNLSKEPENDNDENSYEDFEYNYDENRFMDKDLSDNKRATKTDQGGSHKTKNRKRRNAEIDAAIKVKNELNDPNNEKSNVEILEEEITTEENAVKLYNRRNPKKVGLSKKKPQVGDEDIEGLKEEQEVVAAHFISDPSKYISKTHPIYTGNGRVRHPDGHFRDWTHCIWDTNLKNTNSIHMKNGTVEISKPGIYYVYAQIYYSDQHDINGYYIMKNNEKILGCTTTRHRETQSDSCFTAGLIYFKSNDIMSIKGLDSERYILLDNAKTFFGLFKVS